MKRALIVLKKNVASTAFPSERQTLLSSEKFVPQSEHEPPVCVRPSVRLYAGRDDFVPLLRSSTMFLMTERRSAAITLACSLAENLAAVAKTATPLAYSPSPPCAS